MGVSVFALKRGLADVEIAVGDETLRVTYRPGVITPGMNEATWFDLPVWLSLAVEAWDLLDEQGRVVPLRETNEQGETVAAKALWDLPRDFLLLAQREINKDLLPGKRWRATSAGS
jgi:hypothetical protein